MTHVYIRSEPGLWTVGHYDPAGKWQPESDHGTPEKAAARVAYLNGGGEVNAELLAALKWAAPYIKCRDATKTGRECGDGCGPCSALRAAKSAIAKAEGRAT